MYLALRPDRLICLDDTNFEILHEGPISVVLAVGPRITWDLFYGTPEECRRYLFDLESDIGQIVPVFTRRYEPAAGPDEPEGSFACDDGIAELPL